MKNIVSKASFSFIIACPLLLWLTNISSLFDDNVLVIQSGCPQPLTDTNYNNYATTWWGQEHIAIIENEGVRIRNTSIPVPIKQIKYKVFYDTSIPFQTIKEKIELTNYTLIKTRLGIQFKITDYQPIDATNIYNNQTRFDHLSHLSQVANEDFIVIYKNNNEISYNENTNISAGSQDHINGLNILTAQILALGDPEEYFLDPRILIHEHLHNLNDGHKEKDPCNIMYPYLSLNMGHTSIENIVIESSLDQTSFFNTCYVEESPNNLLSRFPDIPLNCPPDESGTLTLIEIENIDDIPSNSTHHISKILNELNRESTARPSNKNINNLKYKKETNEKEIIINDRKKIKIDKEIIQYRQLLIKQRAYLYLQKQLGDKNIKIQTLENRMDPRSLNEFYKRMRSN